MVSPSEVGNLLAAQVGRPVVALLTAYGDPVVHEPVVRSLLAAGCTHFVCSGPASEALHDRIDDLLVERDDDGFLTTWHDDESAADVAAVFFDAGEEAGTLLVAVIEARDAELATQLVEQTRLAS
jgi:hypothetical protein